MTPRSGADMPRPNNRLYDLLEVSPYVSDAGLRHAYERVTARLSEARYARDPVAQERLAEVKKAFEVLSDPDRRRVYDASGEDAAKAAPTAATPGPTGTESSPQAPKEPVIGKDAAKRLGAAPVPVWSAVTEPEPEPEPEEKPAEEGPTRSVEAFVSFRKACLGGKGEVMVDGEVHALTIPPGVRDGAVIVLDQDIAVTVIVEPDEDLRRHGDDVHIDIDIEDWEAENGVKKVVQGLEGEVTLEIPAGCADGFAVRHRGGGIPVQGGPGRGDLVGIVHVTSSGTPREGRIPLRKADAKAGRVRPKRGP